MQIMKYTLQDFNNICFNGFDFKLPDETINLISELSLQVGSPTYIKTPVFQKREHSLKTTNDTTKKKRLNKNDVVTDEDWESIRTFHTTKIEQKVGIDAQIDIIRSHLNKISDKTYLDLKNKISEIIEQLINDNIIHEDMLAVSTSIFNIASTNRFYSKLYADLYSELINKFDIMKQVFEDSFNSFMEVFNNIEYVDPEKDYDKFCKINKDNEKRKALSAFFVNLTTNGIISKEKLVKVVVNLLDKVQLYIVEEGKKNEVDEMTENIAILCTKDIMEDDDNISQIICNLANSKAKSYSSLTNKSIFKYMDMIEM
jgi:hypothetical protein